MIKSQVLENFVSNKLNDVVRFKDATTIKVESGARTAVVEISLHEHDLSALTNTKFLDILKDSLLDEGRRIGLLFAQLHIMK